MDLPAVKSHEYPLSHTAIESTPGFKGTIFKSFKSFFSGFFQHRQCVDVTSTKITEIDDQNTSLSSESKNDTSTFQRVSEKKSTSITEKKTEKLVGYNFWKRSSAKKAKTLETFQSYMEIDKEKEYQGNSYSAESFNKDFSLSLNEMEVSEFNDDRMSVDSYHSYKTAVTHLDSNMLSSTPLFSSIQKQNLRTSKKYQVPWIIQKFYNNMGDASFHSHENLDLPSENALNNEVKKGYKRKRSPNSTSTGIKVSRIKFDSELTPNTKEYYMRKNLSTEVSVSCPQIENDHIDISCEKMNDGQVKLAETQVSEANKLQDGNVYQGFEDKLCIAKNSETMQGLSVLKNQDFQLGLEKIGVRSSVDEPAFKCDNRSQESFCEKSFETRIPCGVSKPMSFNLKTLHLADQTPNKLKRKIELINQQEKRPSSLSSANICQCKQSKLSCSECGNLIAPNDSADQQAVQDSDCNTPQSTNLYANKQANTKEGQPDNVISSPHKGFSFTEVNVGNSKFGIQFEEQPKALQIENTAKEYTFSQIGLAYRRTKSTALQEKRMPDICKHGNATTSPTILHVDAFQKDVHDEPYHGKTNTSRERTEEPSKNRKVRNSEPVVRLQKVWSVEKGVKKNPQIVTPLVLRRPIRKRTKSIEISKISNVLDSGESNCVTVKNSAKIALQLRRPIRKRTTNTEVSKISNVLDSGESNCATVKNSANSLGNARFGSTAELGNVSSIIDGTKSERKHFKFDNVPRSKVPIVSSAGINALGITESFSRLSSLNFNEKSNLTQVSDHKHTSFSSNVEDDAQIDEVEYPNKIKDVQRISSITSYSDGDNVQEVSEIFNVHSEASFLDMEDKNLVEVKASKQKLKRSSDVRRNPGRKAKSNALEHFKTK